MRGNERDSVLAKFWDFLSGKKRQKKSIKCFFFFPSFTVTRGSPPTHRHRQRNCSIFTLTLSRKSSLRHFFFTPLAFRYVFNRKYIRPKRNLHVMRRASKRSIRGACTFRAQCMCEILDLIALRERAVGRWQGKNSIFFPPKMSLLLSPPPSHSEGKKLFSAFLPITHRTFRNHLGK